VGGGFTTNFHDESMPDERPLKTVQAHIKHFDTNKAKIAPGLGGLIKHIPEAREDKPIEEIAVKVKDHDLKEFIKNKINNENNNSRKPIQSDAMTSSLKLASKKQIPRNHKNIEMLAPRKLSVEHSYVSLEDSPGT
jgi:hypothetical protein